VRKVLSTLLVTAVTVAGATVGMRALASEPVTVTGTAYTSTLQPYSNVRVQIRDLKSALVVSSTTSNASGDYSFENLPPGSYIAEIVDSSNNVVGMSAPFTLGNVPKVTVSVTAAAQGLATSGGGAGFSLLGLGPVSSLAVLGAAGAAAVTAVVTTRQDASPSR
jgi:carboxypeptidase family protein